MRAIAYIHNSHSPMKTLSNQERPKLRKQPKQARSLAMVEAIIEATARILEQHSHEGFSTNAVAELAGVSIGSLYQYFPCKDALMGALIVRESTRLIAEAQKAVTKTNGRAGISAFIKSCVDHQLHRPALARLLDFEEARLPFDRNVQWANTQLRSIITELLVTPDIPLQVDIQAATRDVMAIIKGMVDTAGEYGESAKSGLTERVERAVFGYLSFGSH
ncbi:TetR/AcrR family transcriptional regulator [Xenorhabdus stockiae]|uniref:TetR/AcrR family transcriptional regulator n=1 Tax=Xenorhabdus stockiae TaxID=351614 RepID=UPI004062E52B